MPLFSESLDLDELDARLCGAPELTVELLSDVVEMSCPRFALLRHTERAARAEQLIGSGAWIDAVLALLTLELPQWQLRRLVYDDGEWHCALSSQREMPEWLDQSIDASLIVAEKFQCVASKSFKSAELPCLLRDDPELGGKIRLQNYSLADLSLRFLNLAGGLRL